MPEDILFQPLALRGFSTKNRIFRSNISGRLDNYDGSGNQARINWELKFARGDKIEGITLEDSRAIKAAVSIPVICTGGFQTASVIREAIQSGGCDAVSMARPLVPTTTW